MVKIKTKIKIEINFCFVLFLVICKKPEIVSIKKDERTMIFLSEENTEIVYRERGTDNFEWKSLNNNKNFNHSIIFEKPLGKYLIGFTTNCGVEWFSCSYPYLSNEKPTEPIILFEKDYVNIEIYQHCRNSLYFPEWKIIFNEDNDKREGLQKIFFPNFIFIIFLLYVKFFRKIFSFKANMESETSYYGK